MFVPGLKGCRVLDSGTGWEIIRHDVKWIWLLSEIIYVFKANYDKHRRIDFVRIRGDLTEMKGAWRLVPFNEGKQQYYGYAFKIICIFPICNYIIPD